MVIRTILCVILIFSIVVLTGFTAVAQCDGVYFKPGGGKVIRDDIYFSYYKENYKDFTGDGKPDALGFRREPSDGTYRTVYILPSDGSGGFGAGIQVPLITTFDPTDPANFRVADFNSDGKNDFIVRHNTNPSAIVVYLNNGSGSFTALSPAVVPINERIINVADVNGDGRGDLITAVQNTQSGVYNYYYRTMNADGTFGINIQFIGNAFFNPFEAAADFNGDGKVDFPYLSGQNPNFNLQFLYNQGNGVFAVGGSAISVGNFGRVVGIKDLNNDGKPDLVLSQYLDSANIAVFLNQGGGTFTRTDYTTGSVFDPSFYDFNGDGFVDILLRPNSASYSVLTNNGAGGFALRNYSRRFIANSLIVGDVDGDNKADSISLGAFNLFGNYNPTVFKEAVVRVNKNVCNNFGQTKIVDFDDDGKTDLAFFRPADGRWRYNVTNSNGSVAVNWGQTGDIPVPGDYDGDGKTDIAVFRPSTGGWYIINSSNNTLTGVLYGTNGDHPVPGDYNGDGKTDYAVFRPSNGAWYVLTAGTYQQSGVQFGASDDRPVPADYDGDGKTNIAVFRPSNGVWYVLKPDNGFYGIQYGFGSDVNVAADYDGDGKADIAVYRPGAQSYWYIIRSSDNQQAAIPYGTAGDIPQPGDYNGDGISDLAVYRSGTWYSTVTLAPYSSFAAESGESPVSTLNKSY